MVCLGNICRSPIAEGVLQDLANNHNLNWTVESAGTNQFHTGEAPHKSSQKVCKEKLKFSICLGYNNNVL